MNKIASLGDLGSNFFRIQSENLYFMPCHGRKILGTQKYLEMQNKQKDKKKNQENIKYYE